MIDFKDPAARAAWIYGQPMAPCPKCGSYNMKPQMPIKISLTNDETAKTILSKWAQATNSGATPLEGQCYYMCFDCLHKAPSVDCTGRTKEECGQDRALNDEMKRLWNTQPREVKK